MDWFIDHRPDMTVTLSFMNVPGEGERLLLAIVDPERLRRVLRVMLDEAEFLSPYGVRALSARHRDHPYVLSVEGRDYTRRYEPAESTTEVFGGNSNWRGPVWFPVNYLLIESLQKYHHYLGDDYKVECPTGSGQWMTLWEVAADLSARLSRLFLRDETGRRPAHGGAGSFRRRPALARPGAVLRVLPRRHGRGAGRQPPDRLDRPGGETAPAKGAERMKSSRPPAGLPPSR